MTDLAMGRGNAPAMGLVTSLATLRRPTVTDPLKVQAMPSGDHLSSLPPRLAVMEMRYRALASCRVYSQLTALWMAGAWNSRASS